MVRDDEGSSEDKIPFNRASQQKYTIYDIMDTREPRRFKGGLISMENKTWKNLTEEDNNFVLLFNQRVGYKYPTCELQISPKFKELLDQK